MGVCIEPGTMYAEKLMEHGVLLMFRHTDFGTMLQQ
jgi:hypothetical protein